VIGSCYRDYSVSLIPALPSGLGLRCNQPLLVTLSCRPPEYQANPAGDRQMVALLFSFNRLGRDTRKQLWMDRPKCLLSTHPCDGKQKFPTSGRELRFGGIRRAAWRKRRRYPSQALRAAYSSKSESRCVGASPE